MGVKTFLPCLCTESRVLSTSTNELQSSHTKQSARGAAVVSGDFPEALKRNAGFPGVLK